MMLLIFIKKNVAISCKIFVIHEQHGERHNVVVLRNETFDTKLCFVVYLTIKNNKCFYLLEASVASRHRRGCNTRKKTVIARIKSINRNQDAVFRFFQKYLVLNPNIQGGANARFAPLADTHAIIDYFISGSTFHKQGQLI